MTAFLFPGQGSQRPGMGRDVYEASPTARQVFDDAAEVFGSDFLDTLFNGTPEQLRDTRMSQPALVTTGIALAAHLDTLGIRPEAVAGHSVGEIAALTVAGALPPAHAFRLTRHRANYMADAPGSGAMAAIIGLEADTIAESLPAEIEIANFNSPEQIIISGDAAKFDETLETLQNIGAKRAIRLDVSGAFHSSMMKQAANRLADTLADVPIAAPQVPFISSVSGQAESDPERIRGLLSAQVAAPVRWVDTLQTLGPIDALELGPGNVLQGLARRTPGAPTVRPAGTLEQAEAAVTTKEPAS